MYATRRPSIRRQVVGTFDATKEIPLARRSRIFLRFSCSQVGLSRRLFLLVVDAAVAFLTSSASNSRSHCHEKREDSGTGKKKGRRTVDTSLFAGA